MRLFCILLITTSIFTRLYAQERGFITETYKTVGSAELKVWISESVADTATDRIAKPAIVFFYGGGWVGRNIFHFESQAKHLAERGMIAVLADYRSRNTYGGTPFDCVADAKSAMRYIRANAARLGIDPERIAAGGGSAGGHLAIATAVIEGLNDDSDDSSISSRPNALVLFNPVYDNGPDGYGYDRIGDRYLEFSPYHNLYAGMAPTLAMFGSKDRLVPVETITEFDLQMAKLGNVCDTYIYEGADHAFFNGEPYKSDTIQKMDQFLTGLGYLEPLDGNKQPERREGLQPADVNGKAVRFL
ncbi:alpha/beta hydrolase [Coraliomargarita sp. W4R72]